MIKTNANKSSVKAIREKEKAEREKLIQAKCAKIANDRFTESELVRLSNENKGLWFLPILDDDDEVEKIAVMKPIDRNILGYATTKLEGDGLYAFLEACMNECFLLGDREIIDDDTYFLPAAGAFNKIIEGKKAMLVKR